MFPPQPTQYRSGRGPRFTHSTQCRARGARASITRPHATHWRGARLAMATARASRLRRAFTAQAHWIQRRACDARPTMARPHMAHARGRRMAISARRTSHLRAAFRVAFTAREHGTQRSAFARRRVAPRIRAPQPDSARPANVERVRRGAEGRAAVPFRRARHQTAAPRISPTRTDAPRVEHVRERESGGGANPLRMLAFSHIVAAPPGRVPRHAKAIIRRRCLKRRTTHLSLQRTETSPSRTARRQPTGAPTHPENGGVPANPKIVADTTQRSSTQERPRNPSHIHSGFKPNLPARPAIRCSRPRAWQIAASKLCQIKQRTGRERDTRLRPIPIASMLLPLPKIAGCGRHRRQGRVHRSDRVGHPA